MLWQEMKANQAKGKNNFLVDGFPRNQNNLEGWNKQMEGKAEVKMVLFFDCSEEVCSARVDPECYFVWLMLNKY